MKNEAKTVRLMLAPNPLALLLVEANARHHGAELYELRAQGIGRNTFPVCPHCFERLVDQLDDDRPLVKCRKCQRPFLVLELFDLKSDAFFLSIPWSQ